MAVLKIKCVQTVSHRNNIQQLQIVSNQSITVITKIVCTNRKFY